MARVSDTNVIDLFPLDENEAESVDVMANIEQQAIDALRANQETQAKLRSEDGLPWRGVQEILKSALPEQLDDRNQFAYNLVPKAMNAMFGAQGKAWESFKHSSTGKTWVRLKR